MIITILLIILGLGILIAGAEGLVRGASSLAKRIGISSLVIGLTVVAFGTSMPELTVNIFAALRGAPDIAIGNIVGSNIANILLILGIAALIYPLTVKKSTAYKEIPLALLAIVILFVMGNDILFDQNSANALTRTDGLTLIGIFGIFLFYVINMAKKEKVTGQIKTYPWPLAVALTI
ncbi:MAG: K+-dependent Na+/Ca+ exchanger family protein, partial [Candidatus Falkowbacteria bacterium GW2011_GWA2_39_24]